MLKSSMRSLNELWHAGKERLKSAGIEDAEYDSFALLEYVYGVTRSDYFLNPERKVEESEYLRVVLRRAEHEPLQYIIGTQWFMGYPFEVNEHVLIPRQDTELLVECAVKAAGGERKTLLDLCTGSGCIAISIKKMCESLEVTAADISAQALEVALRNSQINQAEITLVQSDLFDNIPGKYDMIVSNPPYIPTKVIEGLMPEVKCHEPVLALDGSGDGLRFYRTITECAVSHLNKGGVLFYEIGCEQAEAVTGIMKRHGFKEIQIRKDLAGLDRVVVGRCQS